MNKCSHINIDCLSETKFNTVKLFKDILWFIKIKGT